MHRKHTLLAGAAAGAFCLFTSFARADISIFTTAPDWGGSAYGTAAGETGWNGWGQGTSYPNATNNPVTNYYGGPGGSLSLTYTTSLDSTAVNGVGDYDNSSNSTGTPGDDNYAETNYGGQSTASGGVTANAYAGNYFKIVSGEMGGNSTMLNDLLSNSGGNLAIDFTLPGGATTLTAIGATYLNLGVSLNDSNGYKFAPASGTTGGDGTGQADFGTTQSSPGSVSNDANVDPGSYIINDGNGVFTAVLPYSFTDSGGSYLAMSLYYNSNATTTGNVTLDNFRILAVPEPATLGPTALAAGAMALRRRPRRD